MYNIFRSEQRIIDNYINTLRQLSIANTQKNSIKESLSKAVDKFTIIGRSNLSKNSASILHKSLSKAIMEAVVVNNKIDSNIESLKKSL